MRAHVAAFLRRLADRISPPTPWFTFRANGDDLIYTSGDLIEWEGGPELVRVEWTKPDSDGWS